MIAKFGALTDENGYHPFDLKKSSGSAEPDK
jgi:hypothetical protein